MGFFGTLLFLFIFAVFFVFILGLNVLARLLGGVRNLWNLFTKGTINSNSGKFGNGFSNAQKGYGTNQNHSTTSDNQGDRPHSKGVFGDDEGTYVDFEEIKE